MSVPSSYAGTASRPFGARDYLLAAVPFVVVFVIMPCELFFNQVEEWELRLGQVAMLPLAGMLAMFATFGLLAGLATWRQQLARVATLFLFVAGWHLLIADLYSPVQIKHLDGGALTSDEPVKYTALEAAIGLVLLCLFILLLRGKGERIATILAAGVVVVGVGYAGFVLTYLITPDPVITRAEADTKPGSGNVYHIVLDRMQTDAFLEAVDVADARDAFQGFELFRNNIANYLATVPSRASYLTGTFYHEGDYKDWSNKSWRQQGIQKLLSDQGYRVWNYAPFRQWNDGTVDVFRFLRDIYFERTGIAATDFADFVTLWLLRPVPNPLTMEALQPSRDAGEWFLASHNSLSGADPMPADRPTPLTYRKGIEVVSSKYAIEKAGADETLRDDHGEYVYVHAVIPHIPYVFDPACTYRDPFPRDGDETARRQAYLDQSVCSVRLLEGLLTQLRTLDRYDRATIVIHADTGAKEGFFADPPGYQTVSTTLGRPDNELLSGINALLMIKRPHQSAPLRESDLPTQLVDLFPTLLDILDLEDIVDDPIHSQSIYEAKNERRQVRFGYDPHPSKPRGANVIEVRIENPDDLRNSPLTVVGPALEPANWRHEILQTK